MPHSTRTSSACLCRISERRLSISVRNRSFSERISSFDKEFSLAKWVSKMTGVSLAYLAKSGAQPPGTLGCTRPSSDFPLAAGRSLSDGASEPSRLPQHAHWASVDTEMTVLSSRLCLGSCQSLMPTLLRPSSFWFSISLLRCVASSPTGPSNGSEMTLSTKVLSSGSIPNFVGSSNSIVGRGFRSARCTSSAAVASGACGGSHASCGCGGGIALTESPITNLSNEPSSNALSKRAFIMARSGSTL
mmetsp:Transcript_14967/g.41405  ORF Transcript_14967/g.41405 Transcript_14967/m.41405 type:complete len:246 (+) Transcript_14967:162-899(+)